MKKYVKSIGFYICLLVLITGCIFLIKLYKIDILPNTIFIPIAIAFISLCLLICILWLKAKKVFLKVIATVLSILLIFSSCFSIKYIDETVDSIMKISSNDTKTKKVISIYALKMSAVKEEKDLENRVIGILQNN
ncbi:hypothetical protein, partial [Floccifex sp.]|uniref:hypothetical protein n=1 Tax=Floccifex sp. TaxID=2815810 RepID=UPI003EFE4C48